MLIFVIIGLMFAFCLFGVFVEVIEGIKNKDGWSAVFASVWLVWAVVVLHLLVSVYPVVF